MKTKFLLGAIAVAVLAVFGVIGLQQTNQAQAANVTAARQPRAEYLQIILSGAREHGLPAEYIRQIEAIARGRADAGDGAN